MFKNKNKLKMKRIIFYESKIILLGLTKGIVAKLRQIRPLGAAQGLVGARAIGELFQMCGNFSY